MEMTENELEIAEYKLVIVSRFLNGSQNFSDENLIDFFRLLSPSEQYHLFDNLSEEQKLMILAKRNVLLPDVYIACCEKTNVFKNSLSMSNNYEELKRWRKEFKAEDEFGKKIALLIAILKKCKNKEQELEKILFREKRKKLWKQILFFGVFAFCSASFGIGAYLSGFFTGILKFIVEYGIITLGSAITLKGYSELQESYLRESKLIKMLNWMKENEVFKKNGKIPEPPVIKYLKKENNEENDKKVDIDEKFLNFKPNNDISNNLLLIGEAKDKKSKFKSATKILFYVSIFLSLAAVVGSLLFIPGAVALMPFVVSMFVLKISVMTLVIATTLAFIISKFIHTQVQKKREAIKELRAKSSLNKDLSEEIFEKAGESLFEKPNLENEKENVK